MQMPPKHFIKQRHQRRLGPYPTHGHPHAILIGVGPRDDDTVTVQHEHRKAGGARRAGRAYGNGG